MPLTLKQARLMSEKTQKCVADFLGIHLQTYRKIERNPECATVKQVKEISSLLGISYNEIFFGTFPALSRGKAQGNKVKT